ncbi:hypothetical protein CMK18_12220 [Candidatus Poribacteria bacterium]|nr:hypothetical protein [Candidatus Poribacteria bacterium]
MEGQTFSHCNWCYFIILFSFWFWLSTKPAHIDGYLNRDKADKFESIKMVYFVNDPLGGKEKHLEWVK